MSIESDRVCARLRVPVVAPFPTDKVGIALDALHLAPVNGLRHQPERGTCGWYIWGGLELPESPSSSSRCTSPILALDARPCCLTWPCLPAAGFCLRLVMKTCGSTPRC
jgi:hypothetical protein